ncbi:MAG: class I SAM-dependent methyltransferase [Hyphomicrobiales bacterium]|nr:class I SAM-dependent methyltransferase [Hyphomicrobiales bacterium]
MRARVISLHLLDSLGLLLPAYRLWEYARSVGGETDALGPDGLPLPPPRLRTSVSGAPDLWMYVEGGELAEKSVREALDRCRVAIGSLRAILDFGCGCGRVLRRWRGLDARICGADVNAAAVNWCRAHLPFAEVGVNGLEPPLAYGEATFDLVYAISVFTHLPVRTQLAWRDELRRVLRPGGLLLLSVAGDAYIDRLTRKERRIYADGECVVRRPTAAGANICVTFHPPAFVRSPLADGWELLDHTPRGSLGSPHQDLVVLRKPSS